jgi:serine/threonine protein phosphatase PrpC
MPAPKGDGPFRKSYTIGPWTVEVGSSKGPARPVLEDAWCVLPNLEWRGSLFHALAVFDGVAGKPHGREAAWSAADHLSEVIQASEGFDDVLPGLNRIVKATGGATSCVVALLSVQRVGEVALASVGDSTGYALDMGGRVRRLTPRDSMGKTWLTDFLGNDQLAGHVFPLHVPADGTLMLCTDGVDGVVDMDTIESTMSMPPGAQSAAFDVLFDTLGDAGTPDNATAILAHRGR